jgi:hypothetical protein
MNIYAITAEKDPEMARVGPVARSSAAGGAGQEAASDMEKGKNVFTVSAGTLEVYIYILYVIHVCVCVCVCK